MVKSETCEEVKKEIHVSKSKKDLLMEKLKPFMDEEATKMVKGRFRNIENPGGSAPINVLKYPGIPQFSKEMVDGDIYEIPLYVARFINGIDITSKNKRIDTCSYATHGFKWDVDKNAPPSSEKDGTLIPIVHVAKRNQRFAFESLSFSLEGV